MPLAGATNAPLQALLPAIQQLDPQRATAVLQALVNLETLQREHVSLITPTYVFPEQN
jgi:hypothetical protein